MNLFWTTSDPRPFTYVSDGRPKPYPGEVLVVEGRAWKVSDVVWHPSEPRRAFLEELTAEELTAWRVLES